jgi:hypothetical protein
LTTTHEISSTIAQTIKPSSPAPSASKLLAFIEDQESTYQSSLNDSYQGMSDKTYKALRRALPMTRSKMDWDKVRNRSISSTALSIDWIRFWDINWEQNYLTKVLDLEHNEHTECGVVVEYIITNNKVKLCSNRCDVRCRVGLKATSLALDLNNGDIPCRH